MEAALLHSSPDQSISPNKQFTNRKRNNQPLISRSSENFTPSNFHGGLLHAPRRSLSLLNPQPPLLPLPIPKPNINPLSRGLSCPSKKIKNRKKSKTPVNSDSKPDLKSTECVLIGSTNPLGPDPKDLPKDVSRVLSSSAEKFSDLSEVFSLSPPPSSLPLKLCFLLIFSSGSFINRSFCIVDFHFLCHNPCFSASSPRGIKSSWRVMKKKGKKTQKIRKKEEVAEDWCFVCKDGGKLLVCEYKQCLKSYHADCVGLDESVFDTGNRWTCGLHSCFICEKDSKFHCYCCPTGMCQRCITGAEFTRVKGHKGFCNNCLKLALLGEENMDVDSDGEKVDFKDRETYEGLFMEYWEIIKEEEGLTLEHLHAADAQLKKGENYKSGSRRVESNKDEENQSDYDDEDDDEIEEPKLVQKVKRPKRHKKREVKSNKREFIGWGSKSLIDFLSSIGKDARKRLSQYDISSIINGYINENKLFRPEKKNKILCDERLKSVLGRKSINRNKIYDLLEPHLLENLDLSEEDEVGNSSEDEEESVLVASKKQRKLSSCRKSQEKGVVFDAPLSWFAAVVAENIKLVFLKRSLVQELLKKPETSEDKVIGSFVRVKSEPSDSMQGFSHQLVQVTGMKKPSPGESNSEILLQVSNMSKDIRINMLSEDNFSEEECEDLKQKVKAGLLKRPTMVELEQKAKTLHEDITKHWIAKELALLQNLIDRANEKGWRAELFEYLERRQLLQKPSEQLRLLQKVPRALADISDFEPTSQKSMLKGSSETPGDNNGGNGISLGDGAVTNGNSSFGNIGSSSANDGNGNGNVQATQGNNAGCNIQVAKEKEDHSEVSVIEKLPEQPNAPEDQSNVILQSEPHQSSSHIDGQKQSQPKDSKQKIESGGDDDGKMI